MLTSKLTLSIKPEVIASAKRYAQKRGVSVSNIVETYLAAVSSPPAVSKEYPVLRAIRGTLKNVDVEDYRKYLVDKYL